MAKVTFNNSIAGLSGKVDRWIFRAQNGRTVIVPHRERDQDAPSVAQVDRRKRFGEAQAYAKKVLADPLKRDRYRKLAAERKCPPNALLISNFLNPPTIEQMDVAGYTGAPGSLIRVLATDAIEVVSVTVLVRSAGEETLEAGAAVKDHDVWAYRCTTSHALHAPVQIEVTAENRAGAKGVQTVSPAGIV